MTFAFERQDILASICGPNNVNLREIEDGLACTIHMNGNQISLMSEDPDIQASFGRVMSILRELSRTGRDVDPSQVRALIDAQRESTQEEDARMKSINIPVGTKVIYPKSRNQLKYIDAMFSDQLVFGIGPAGTGKTFLAIAKAVHDIHENKRQKIILTRPVVEAGESLGFLPGDFAQKISPYLRPLYDALEYLIPVHTVRRMEENGVIEIAPLAYMRGRSLQNAFVILDEAQNTTQEQMKMFLTRLGENSQAVITGDITQIDLPKRKQSGLLHAIHILKDIDDITIHHFGSKDVIRSRLVRKIVEAYQRDHHEA